MVEEPWLLVSGLLHESDCPTLLGSVAFSRATLSKSIWLSEGARPGPKFPANGMTWACAATGRRTHTANAAKKQCGNRDRMHLSFTFSAPPPLSQYDFARFNFGTIGSIRAGSGGRIRRVLRPARWLV